MVYCVYMHSHINFDSVNGGIMSLHCFYFCLQVSETNENDLDTCSQSQVNELHPPRQLFPRYSISSCRLEMLVLPTGFHLQNRLITVSQVAARMSWCIAATENPICLWLLSVTFTITQLLPVIKATLLFLGHFLLLLLSSTLRPPPLPLPFCSHPPVHPLNHLFPRLHYEIQLLPLKSPLGHMLFTHIHNIFFI